MPRFRVRAVATDRQGNAVEFESKEWGTSEGQVSAKVAFRLRGRQPGGSVSVNKVERLPE